MTWWTGARARKLLKFGGAAVLIGTVFTILKIGAAAPSKNQSTQREAAKFYVPEQSESFEQSGGPELTTYIVGYMLALALTMVAFAVVHWHWARPSTALGIVFALALVQIIVHFRCFLHVALHGPARDDLQLIAFSTLIVLLMVGGTLVVLFNLRMRMM